MARLKQKNTNLQGNVGLGEAIAYFTNLGKIVSLPLNDSQDYDLIIDDKNGLQKVQVKTTTTKGVDLRTNGRNYSKLFNNKSVDLLFVTTRRKNYLIPCKNIKQTTMISISLLENYKI